MNLAGILTHALTGIHLMIMKGYGEDSQSLGDVTVASVDIESDGMIVLHGEQSYIRFRPSPDIRFVEVVAEIPEKKPAPRAKK